jgi:hypothetical protein
MAPLSLSSTSALRPGPLARSDNASLYALYGLWMLDYRADSGDSIALVLQLLALAVSLVTFGLRLGRRDLRIVGALKPIVGVFVLFNLWASVSGLALGQQVYAVASLSLPLAMFVMYAIYCHHLFLTLQDPGKTIRTLTKLLTVSVVAKFFITVFILRIDLSEVRYQILSAGNTAAGAAMVASFYSRFFTEGIVLAIANLAAMFMSVTRTNIGIVAILMGLFLTFSPKMALRYFVLRRFGAALLLAVPLGAYALTSGNDVVSRWSSRLSHAEEMGFDVTAATRRAEVEAQFEALSDSFRGAAFGFGLAAENKLSGFYAALIRDTSGLEKEADLVDIGYGHNVYTGLLFTGGFVFGGMMNATLLYLVYIAARTIYKLAAEMRSSEFAYAACWGALTVLGVSIMGALGGTLGDRGTALWFGTAVGMMLAARTRAGYV